MPAGPTLGSHSLDPTFPLMQLNSVCHYYYFLNTHICQSSHLTVSHVVFGKALFAVLNISLDNPDITIRFHFSKLWKAASMATKDSI